MNVQANILSVLLLSFFYGCTSSAKDKSGKAIVRTQDSVKIIQNDDSSYKSYYNLDSLKLVVMNTATLEGKVSEWKIRQVLQFKAIHPNDIGLQHEAEDTLADIDGDGKAELLTEKNCFYCGTGNYNFCQTVYFMDDAGLFEDTPRIQLSNPVWDKGNRKVYSCYIGVPYTSGEGYYFKKGKLNLFESIYIQTLDSNTILYERSDKEGKPLSSKIYSNFESMFDVDVFPSYRIQDRKKFGLYLQGREQNLQRREWNLPRPAMNLHGSRAWHRCIELRN